MPYHVKDPKRDIISDSMQLLCPSGHDLRVSGFTGSVGDRGTESQRKVPTMFSSCVVVYIFLYIHGCLYIYICIYTHLHVHFYMYMYLCIDIYYI